MKQNLLLIVCLFFTSCYTYQQRPVVLATPFNEEDLQSFMKKGDNTITGQAFLTTRGGDVKYGAGRIVTMVPSTPYTEEWFNRTVIAYKDVNVYDKRLEKFMRQTTADGDGKFEFNNLPNGSYLIQCTIQWEVPSPYGYGYGMITTGSHAYAKVNVNGGETVKAIVTRN